MLSCSIWFYAPSFWLGGGLESRCVGRVYGADGAARHHPHHTHVVGTWFKISSDILDIFLLWCLPKYNFLFICSL